MRGDWSENENYPVWRSRKKNWLIKCSTELLDIPTLAVCVFNVFYTRKRIFDRKTCDCNILLKIYKINNWEKLFENLEETNTPYNLYRRATGFWISALGFRYWGKKSWTMINSPARIRFPVWVYRKIIISRHTGVRITGVL